ncbi:MAG TPA: S41 family peptidase [Candidatus Baltobacteraceae bacterium]|nr:S41 family peptidase [Candidatus Baltobacteraceae bacterium]
MAIGLIAAFPTTIGAAPATNPSQDLRQSYELLTTTYYSKIDAQRLLDGARQALLDDAAKRHLHISVPQLHDTGSLDGNVNQVLSTITRAGVSLHLSQTQLTYDAINGMARALGDRYTTFFTPDEYRQFNAALDPEKISGIGVIVRADEASKYIQAEYVVPGTPAEKAGLETGDLFATVDGKSLKGLTADDASSMLRGKPGSVVHVQALRDGKQLPVMDIIRSEVQPPTVIYKMLPQHVGYVYILAFGRETPDEFAVALDRLQKDDVRAYVIDLRDDGGGYVNSALDISSKFINSNPLLTIEERGSHTTTVDAGTDALPRKPMAILVNRYTASASEITAGALQDNGIGVLVGEKTFGKGVMQSLTALPDGAAIKITTAHYLTPKNRDINLKGIEPDYVVVENKDARFGDLTRDAQLQTAITILTKKIADVKN